MAAQDDDVLLEVALPYGLHDDLGCTVIAFQVLDDRTDERPSDLGDALPQRSGRRSARCVRRATDHHEGRHQGEDND
ncbi:MAG: hypothetical protein H0T98_06720 [Euzebyaceae bacterium]|jgi:hypothetical protein|nr:hypothetical protein [Euzebyaceae bacterium]